MTLSMISKPRFINRQMELDFLERKFKSKESELIILYGRRRIGKTELILKFCTGKKFMYFIGRLESREDTLKRFNNLIIEAFNDTNLLLNPLSNWDSIFTYLADKTEERLVLVFDELPFIIERFPEFVSILQDKWDNKLRSSDIMLVLCGSSVSMMEKYALDLKSPLYGRRTGQWKIEKIAVSHLKGFFPEYKTEEIVQLYSCIDSIPGYLTKFSPDKTVLENIKEKIFSKGEFLYEEIEILLREELRDPSNYMSILSSIAGGLTTFNEIHAKTGLDKSLLSKYLHTLEALGIIEKITPVTESYKAKLKYKGALYFIKDNFFDFWFRFVYAYKQELEKGNPDLVIDMIKTQFNSYVGIKFERFVMELIPLSNIGSFSKIGRWWHKDKEIDAVAIDEKGKEILFVECKWQKDIDAIALMRELIEKSKNVDWENKKRKETYAIFAKSFSKKIKEFEQKKVYCLDLGDITKFLAMGQS